MTISHSGLLFWVTLYKALKIDQKFVNNRPA